jgi:hypothetical protein
MGKAGMLPIGATGEGVKWFLHSWPWQSSCRVINLIYKNNPFLAADDIIFSLP